MRQSGNQIEADIAETGVAKNPRGVVNIFATVHAPGGFQFLVTKRLDAHADAIESRVAPGGCFFGCNCFGIGFEGHFFEFAIEARANRVENAAKTVRVEKAWRSAAKINGVDNRVGNCRDCRFRAAGVDIPQSRGKPRRHRARTDRSKTHPCGSCSRCTWSGRTEPARKCRVAWSVCKTLAQEEMGSGACEPSKGHGLETWYTAAISAESRLGRCGNVADAEFLCER